MADELKLKIVLDDGSVKEGFLSVEKNADQAAKKIGKSFDKQTDGLLSGLSAAQASFVAVSAVAASAGLAIKKAFDFTLLGESVKAVEKQFNTLADSAGISGDALKESVISATKGLIDDEDALQIASRSIVALGKEAEKLPQILDLARGASKALGRDFKESFQDLSTFVEFGNARALRNYGIVLDLDKAYEKAAKSIGLTAAQLTEQQKQTIRSNLLLTQAADKFKNVTDSVTPLKDSVTRLNVAFNNFLESVASSNYFGRLAGGFQVLIDKTTTWIKSFSDEPKDKLDVLNEKINETEARIGALLEAKKAREGASGFFSALVQPFKDGEGSLTVINQRIASYRQQLEALRLEQEKLDTGSKKITGTIDTKDNEVDLKATSDQNKLKIEERIKQEQALSTFLQNEEIKRLNLTLQNQQLEAQNATSFGAAELQREAALKTQSQILEAQHNLALEAINQQFKNSEYLSVIEKNAAIEAAEKTHEQNLTNLKNKSEQDRLALKKKFDAAGLAATSQALNQIATLQESSSKELAAIGKAAALTQATIDGYAAVQNALANIPAPFNFAAAALVGVAAAQNIAKIAAVGGGGGSSAFSADTGGGIATSPSTTTELTPTENLQRQEPQTNLTVNIQGDVLDSDESGSRIVDLINQSFSKKGVVINQGVMA